MKASASRIPGFYKVTVPERRALLAQATGTDESTIASHLIGGGLDAETADKFVENVVGTYALPLGLVLNMTLNGRDYLVPMAVEEPSVVAAASNAAKMARAGGGFRGTADDPVMTAQIQLLDVPNVDDGAERLQAHEAELLARADQCIPGIVERGGGSRAIEVRRFAEAHSIVVHVYVDCRDAMGANLVNTVAEALAERVAELSGGRVGLRILSNLCDRRCVRVTCRVPHAALATVGMSGSDVARGIEDASRFAETDPYRAATHNKGIMNGLDAVVIATGNDWRAVEAGAHAYAARNGRYEPLATWRVEGEDLVGHIELPLALGIVGGTLRVHPAARLALRWLDVASATELAMVAAATGLASNLAALRALATDGIQRGHMALHARAVAVAAGARGRDVDRVAAQIVEARDITTAAAERALGELRAAKPAESAGDDLRAAE